MWRGRSCTRRSGGTVSGSCCYPSTLSSPPTPPPPKTCCHKLSSTLLLPQRDKKRKENEMHVMRRLQSVYNHFDLLYHAWKLCKQWQYMRHFAITCAFHQNKQHLMTTKSCQWMKEQNETQRSSLCLWLIYSPHLYLAGGSRYMSNVNITMFAQQLCSVDK